MSVLGGLLMAVGLIAMAGFWLLSLLGWAVTYGLIALIVALFFPPMDLAYPIAARVHYGVWPTGLIAIGVGGFVLAIVGSMLRDAEWRG